MQDFGIVPRSVETDSHSIAPIDGRSSRPPITVVLPTFEPTAHLQEALRSVLIQDLGAESMQILVIDDASPTCDVEALVADAAPRGRIEFMRNEKNLGLALNWNRCIGAARGEVIHILHQDDRVEPGFYARMLPPFAKSARIGMAFCRHTYIDDDGVVTHTSHKERWRPGVLRNWLDTIAEWQRIQCASALVRRSVYERLGGFRPELCYALDWEMWTRIAVHYDVWYDPKSMAAYRRHAANETRRLQDNDRIERDTLLAIEVIARNLPDHKRAALRSDAYATFARKSLKRLKSADRPPRHTLVENLNFAIARIETRPRLARRYRMRLSEFVG